MPLSRRAKRRNIGASYIGNIACIAAPVHAVFHIGPEAYAHAAVVISAIFISGSRGIAFRNQAITRLRDCLVIHPRITRALPPFRQAERNAEQTVEP